MMQTLAILNDSLRELRSRSLFWIALLISVFVSFALFGLIGFDENGWHILWLQTNVSESVRAGSQGMRDLLGWLFGGALLWWWLTWGAIVIALIVNASAIPEFVSSGSIDLVLAKPIGRVRLFLVKILGALLFTLFQVTACVLVAYLLVGFRFGIWFHHAWLAVPLVTLQFFYLFSVMALVGLVTRSTLASLLAALIFWGMVSLVQFASNQVDAQLAQASTIIELQEKRIAEIQGLTKNESREPTMAEQIKIRRAESQMEPYRGIRDALAPWQRPVNSIELLVPKTGDIQKIVADAMDAPPLSALMLRLQGVDPDAMAKFAGMSNREEFIDAQKAGVAGDLAARSVSAVKSIGSSLTFAAVVLGICVWIFVRRDF